MNISRLRADFARPLAQTFNQHLGTEGSEVRTRLESAYGSILTNGELDLEKLPEKARLDLAKLQKSSEEFEGFFIKQLLSKMRSTSFAPESSPTMDFARDTMDQAIAEASARNTQSIGIAKTVFLSQGLRIVQDCSTKTESNTRTL